MKKHIIVFSLILAVNVPVLSAAPTYYKIVTGGPKGTYIQIGRNLSDHVAREAGIKLDVKESAGSLENVRRMRSEKHVKLAIVQHDVFRRYKEYADSGNKNAKWLVNRLRVVLPLYNEEVHLIVRKNSNIDFIHQIKDKKINFGSEKSGTAMTISLLYKSMFGRVAPRNKSSFHDVRKAMWMLVKTKEVDVVGYVAGQPTSLLADLDETNSKYYKLLNINPNHRTYKIMKKDYYDSTIKRSSYPKILKKNVTTIAVKAYLITFDFKVEARRELSDFARSLCRNFPTLQEKGHKKWREVALKLSPLPGGWTYYDATEKVLSSCEVGEVICDNLARDLGIRGCK